MEPSLARATFVRKINKGGKCGVEFEGCSYELSETRGDEDKLRRNLRIGVNFAAVG
jgi:hypothetical protein